MRRNMFLYNSSDEAAPSLYYYKRQEILGAKDDECYTSGVAPPPTSQFVLFWLSRARCGWVAV